jgi:mono/diheme cytochrome c family protein
VRWSREGAARAREQLAWGSRDGNSRGLVRESSSRDGATRVRLVRGSSSRDGATRVRRLAAAMLLACGVTGHAGPVVIAATASVVAACGAAGHGGPVVTAATDESLGVASDIGLVMLDRTTYAFEPGRVTVLRGARVIARVDAPGQPWTAAVGLAGPDGDRWAVGLAGGALWRVTPTGELELAGARLGIGDARVLAIDASGAGFAIGLAGGVAISRDGVHLERFAGGDATHVALADSRVAVGHADAIEVFDLERDADRGHDRGPDRGPDRDLEGAHDRDLDRGRDRDLAHATRVTYAVSRPSAVGFAESPGEDARLVALAGGTLYAEDRGVLRRIPAPGKVSDLAVSGSRIWIVASGGLFSLDPRQRTLVEVVPALPPGSRLHRASGRTSTSAPASTAANAPTSNSASDIWVSRAGQSVRYSLEPRPSARDWQVVVAPVFQRACSKCHLPDGQADLDLSTPARWAAHATIIHHMVDSQAMPPAGSPISDVDRQALLGWLAR